MNEVIKILQSYTNLEEDWDGYNGIAPLKSTVDNLINILNTLPVNIKLPIPMCSGLGTVGVYWEINNQYAEICVDDDFTVISYVLDKEWNKGTVNCPNISQELIKLIIV